MICLILHVNGVHTVKAIFKAFPSDNSRQLFFCYSGHVEDTKSAEFGSFAISWRSNYMFTGLTATQPRLRTSCVGLWIVWCPTIGFDSDSQFKLRFFSKFKSIFVQIQNKSLFKMILDSIHRISSWSIPVLSTFLKKAYCKGSIKISKNRFSFLFFFFKSIFGNMNRFWIVNNGNHDSYSNRFLSGATAPLRSNVRMCVCMCVCVCVSVRVSTKSCNMITLSFFNRFGRGMARRNRPTPLDAFLGLWLPPTPHRGPPTL